MQTDSEDMEMLDTSTPSINLQRRLSREIFQNHLASNGTQQLNRDPLDGMAPSNRTSRATSVLAKDTKQLSLSSPYESPESEREDDVGAAEDLTTEPLPYHTLRTGLCYDSRMRFHTELAPPKDRSDYHPEDPRRILHIYRELCEAGLVAVNDSAIAPLTSNPVYRILARPATRPEILLVHDQSHFDFLKSTSAMTEDELLRKEILFDSIYFNRQTYSAALLSAGAAVETCLAVATGTVKNAIAVIRPPGHHAERDVSRGFCHFDNVSIATEVVRERYPQEYRKVMIVDWDVHHGNGIQQAFESNPNVLYISIHVHENGNFYPSGPYGDHLHCGIGAGVGKNINIPWPTKGMGDADYLFAFQHIIMPVAFDFDPDMVIIAAGFDAAVGDQLGGCFVTPACYAHMTHMLMSLAKGKLVVCLEAFEGGYNLNSISKSSLAVTKTLMGEPPDRLQETAATRIGIQTVKRVILQQSKYWKCLYPKDVAIVSGAERMHDVVRAYQSKQLHESHKMINLWIFRETISKSFENQVLATTNYSSDIPLLVIFHDPPEVIGVSDPLTRRLDLHNTWLADVSKNYVEWAATHGFGVIDVNIPHFLTGISVEDGDEEDEILKMDLATNELAIYLWENYIECNDSTRIIFMGVGEAYKAILHILNTRNYEALEQIAGIVGFIGDNPIRPVTETFITDFGKWYYRRTHLLLPPTHPLWTRDKKPSKKFGTLVRSPAASINEALTHHLAEIQEFLARRAGLPFPPPAVDPDTILVANARKEGEEGRKGSSGSVGGGGVGGAVGRGSSVSNSGGAAMVRAGSSGVQTPRAGSVMQRAVERLGLERSAGSSERSYGMFGRK